MSKNEHLVERFRKEMNDLTSHLLQLSLVDDQNSVARREVGQGLITLEANYWTRQENRPDIYASVPYAELYRSLVTQRSYDLRFLDGGLIQVRFEFTAEKPGMLTRSRLAYLPSPDLTSFQEDPDIYLHDELYGDVVDIRAVTIPLRFDYDASESVVEDLNHPVSHVTLGQFPHCRIAATGPVSPYYFVEFILRSFYRTSQWIATEQMPQPRVDIPITITSLEKSLLHFSLPTCDDI
jgi:hypothetical protein